MHTVVVQQQITTIELMKEQSKKQKKTKNKRIKISCMKGLRWAIPISGRRIPRPAPASSSSLLSLTVTFRLLLLLYIIRAIEIVNLLVYLKMHVL